MSYFPSVLWEKVLHYSRNSPLHSFLNKKFESTENGFSNVESNTNQSNNAYNVDEMLFVTPHLHPTIFPPFSTEELSYQQLEYRLRNHQQTAERKMLLDELNRKIQKKFNGDFELYVREELLNKVKRNSTFSNSFSNDNVNNIANTSNPSSRTESLLFNQVLEDEIQILMQKAKKRETMRKKWIQDEFIPHFGAPFDQRWKLNQETIRSVDQAQSDPSLKYTNPNVHKDASALKRQANENDTKQDNLGIKNNLIGNQGKLGHNENINDWGSSIDSLEFIPFSQQYRLERTYMFEKKVMNIFKDNTLMKDESNIFDDPFGKGLEASLEPYHPHHFMSVVANTNK